MAVRAWPHDSRAMALGEELWTPSSLGSRLRSGLCQPGSPARPSTLRPPCEAAAKAVSRPVTPQAEARTADGPLCLPRSRGWEGVAPETRSGGAARGGVLRPHPQPRPLGTEAPAAHLGEGGHRHAVGPLLEGAGRLRGEGSGRRTVVGRREGQVVLVQEVARAAALPLLQAAGAQGRRSRPGRPSRHPARPGAPRLSPSKGGTKAALAAWLAAALAVWPAARRARRDPGGLRGRGDSAPAAARPFRGSHEGEGISGPHGRYLGPHVHTLPAGPGPSVGVEPRPRQAADRATPCGARWPLGCSDPSPQSTSAPSSTARAEKALEAQPSSVPRGLGATLRGARPQSPTVTTARAKGQLLGVGALTSCATCHCRRCPAPWCRRRGTSPACNTRPR